MNSLNRVEIIGNLTRDPEMKTTQGGQSLTTIGVATNRSWTDNNGVKREETEFHSVICWGKLAEICVKFLHKGGKVFFAGRLQTKSWEDESKIKHWRTEIIAQDMIVLSFKDKVKNNEKITASLQDEDLPTGNLHF
jgi:single-strand DNA-binding protein